MLNKISKVKKIVRLLAEGILLLFWVALAWQYDLVLYGIRQGLGQWQISQNAQPISSVLSNPTTADSVKQKLQLVNAIRQFCFTDLGLKPNANYTHYYDYSKGPHMWVVSASEAFALKPYQWRFPIVGTVSYKGYFNQELALQNYLSLKSQGYDADIYSPSGWSTLGWFTDPLLSSMLNQSAGQLAELLIHELTHGTIYLKGEVQHNENLANFIGQQGALLFLIKQFGSNAAETIAYQREQSDEKITRAFMLQASSKLDSIYNGFLPNLTHNAKMERKAQAFKFLYLKALQLPLYNHTRYRRYFNRGFRKGNAFFVSYLKYDAQYSTFEEALRTQHKGNLKAFIKAYQASSSNTLTR